VLKVDALMLSKEGQNSTALQGT
jgi:hypothetical protein